MRLGVLVLLLSITMPLACGGKSETTGSGGSGGTDAGGKTCQDLTSEYAAALADAKKCDPAVNTLLCTAKTGSALFCGCPTFYNPANKDAVNQLATLSQQAQAMGCQVPCPAIGCTDPTSAGCSPMP